MKEQPMKNNASRPLPTSLFVAGALAVLCGCKPEETFLVVNASALKSAEAGNLAQAQVEMVFDIESDDKDLPSRIKRVALPYLGPGAAIEIEKTEKRRVREGGSLRDEEEEVDSSLDDAKMVGRFSIPVGTEETLRQAPRSILWLKYTPADHSFRLVPGNAVQALNSALSDVSSDVEFEYTGGTSRGFSGTGTTVKIVADVPVTVGTAATTVNGTPVIAGSRSLSSGSLKINYDNQFYENFAPCFTLGSFPTMPTERLGSDDDD